MMPIHSRRLAEATRINTARALLGLHFVVLTIAVLQFAFVPGSVEHPSLAVVALLAQASVLLLVRVLPGWHAVAARQHAIDIAAMVVAITLLAFATGAARSAVVPLYLAPLTAIAIAFARWWLVLLLATLIAALGFVLGIYTPQIDIGSPEFGVLLLSSLAPGIAVALLLAAQVEKVQSAAQMIDDLAATDSLTGLLNYRAFDQVLQQEHRKADRFGRSYAVIIVDVDNVAAVNDTLGHEAGNQIIKAVAAAITRSIRNSDVAARFGGDEFIVLLAEADSEIATTIAQRIRHNVYAGTVSLRNRLVRANVSLGLANYPADHLFPKELMMLANQRMQQDRELRREQNANA